MKQITPPLKINTGNDTSHSDDSMSGKVIIQNQEKKKIFCDNLN